MQTLDTLNVYLMAKEFRKEVVKTANQFPVYERFLLTAQVKDSARSITANIAEGIWKISLPGNDTVFQNGKRLVA